VEEEDHECYEADEIHAINMEKHSVSKQFLDVTVKAHYKQRQGISGGHRNNMQRIFDKLGQTISKGGKKHGKLLALCKIVG
jgi:hypothetical protein